MTVRFDVDGGVATITLASPETRNVLTAESMADVRTHLDAAAADPAVRVVVLTGEGTTFCAGADLSGALAGDADSFTSSGPAAMAALLEALLDHPKPVVARVQGHVAGGGNGLVAACDIAVAAESAKFAFSEVRVGVAPAVISVVCLAVMHRRDAQELLLTGERVSAHRVREAGLVTTVAEDETLDVVVTSYVDALMAGGPEALGHTKNLMRRVPALTRDESFAFTAQLSGSLFASDEAREGMGAFLERRSPRWAPTRD